MMKNSSGGPTHRVAAMRRPRLTTTRQFIMTSPSAERSRPSRNSLSVRARARARRRVPPSGAALRADAAAGDAYDLLAVSDVLVYVGDLAPFFAAARDAARPGATLALTVEDADGDGPYELAVTGRYRHAPAYCDAAAAAAGWTRVEWAAATLRKNGGVPVPGSVFVFRR